MNDTTQQATQTDRRADPSTDRLITEQVRNQRRREQIARQLTPRSGRDDADPAQREAS